MKNRIFVVFAFSDEVNLSRFKRTLDMRYVAARKLAVMEPQDVYESFDVLELFDDVYMCYLLYELGEPYDEISQCLDFQMESAS